MCGVIFDAPQHRARLKALEARIAAPDFWNNQEEAQNVLRQRKVADDQINADEKLGIIFKGKKAVSMFEMTALVSKNLVK